MNDILDQIDAATSGLCACGCKRPIPDGGLSAWFAGEGCQRRWHAARTDRPDEVLATPPPFPGYHNAGIGIDVDAGVWHSIRAAIDSFAEIGRPNFEALQALFAQIQAAKRPADDGPTDPMERALWLRKNRNTGPKMQRRAPRNLGVGRR